MSSLPDNFRINLAKAAILLLEPNQQGVDILVQILTGFGAKTFHRCRDVDEAKDITKQNQLELVIAEAQFVQGQLDGCDFVRWLRRSGLEPNASVPVILLTGHTALGNVQKSRDCGADFMVAKPLIPSVLLERVIWVARESRSFVETATYLGPDRRVRNLGPPPGLPGRRSSDVDGELGVAKEPNMSQDEIDNLILPTRAIK